MKYVKIIFLVKLGKVLISMKCFFCKISVVIKNVKLKDIRYFVFLDF